MNDFLPFALPDIGEDEIAELIDTVRSGWLTTGPKTKQFELDFAEFVGNNVQAIAVSSATAGLHLALEAVGVGEGDEVITTPYTFTATAEVIRYLGAEVVFADIDPETFNINPVEIESAVTPRTKAIIPVHFAGLACNMAPIWEIANKYELKVVEDAAHALPTTHRGRIVGSLESHATVFSFYVTKTLAVGEGGMVVTHNNDIAERCRIMCSHGIDRNVYDRYTSNKPVWYYEVIRPGFKYNMTDIAASIGIHQLRKVWAFQKHRAEMAARYNDAFKDLPVILPPAPPPNDVHSLHLYVLQLADDVDISRNRFIELLAKKGIGSSVHFIPLHLQPYWRDRYNLGPQDFSKALKVYERAVSLPLYTKMSGENQERVIKAVEKILK